MAEAFTGEEVPPGWVAGEWMVLSSTGPTRVVLVYPDGRIAEDFEAPPVTRGPDRSKGDK